MKKVYEKCELAQGKQEAENGKKRGGTIKGR